MDQDGIKDSLVKCRNLAIAACNFDEVGNLAGAIRNYDDAIIVIDEVLTTIPSSCDAWQLLMIYREKYSSRMEKIRFIDLAQRENTAGPTSSPKSKRRMSKVPFNDKLNPIDLQAPPVELLPQSVARRPFWLLRVLRNIIADGGFISTRVYVPKLVWSQFGMKFTGLSVKTAAFEHVMIAVTSRIFPAELPTDAYTTATALDTMRALNHDLFHLQNNLSKPFPFIKEIHRDKEASPTPQTGSNVGKISSMVSLLGKNVVKYAEVGYQRIGASLPSRMADDELANFASLASELCEKCQIIDSWYEYIDHEIQRLQLAATSAATPDDVMTGESGSVSSDMTEAKILPPSAVDTPGRQQLSVASSGSFEFDYTDEESDISRLASLLDLRAEMNFTSEFTRDVICELLLRDTEYLLDRYMRKMRKSFSRMYWDDEVGEEK